MLHVLSHVAGTFACCWYFMWYFHNYAAGPHVAGTFREKDIELEPKKKVKFIDEKDMGDKNGQRYFWM